MKDQNGDEELYRALKLLPEERAWVAHFLRAADNVLFGRQPAPRVVVVDEGWRNPEATTDVPIPKKKVA